jgi:hypothetical protein
VRYGEFAPLEQGFRLRPVLRRKTEAVRVARAPVIDGVMQEGEYAGAPPASGFRPPERHTGSGKQTRFYTAYDDERLYLAVVAEEDNPAALEKPKRDRDGDVWRDDSIEVFLDASRDRTTYHQFIANLAGSRFDGVGGPEHGKWGNKEWNADWQAAAKPYDDHYVMEIAIPFADLGVAPPGPGDVWGLHVGRGRSPAATGKADSEVTGWAIVYVNFHQVSHYGDVTFR